MTPLDYVALIAGFLLGLAVSRLAIKALRLHHAVTDIPAGASLPTAVDASERGDLASIPKQNFWR